MNKRKKIKRIIAGLLSVATVLGSVMQSVSIYADLDDGNIQSVSSNSVSGNDMGDQINIPSVSGGDMEAGGVVLPTVSGSDAQYDLGGYFGGETYVSIRGKGTSEVAKMRCGDYVLMDLAWRINADEMNSKGIAEFIYSLPLGVSWEESEGNIGNGTYRLGDGSLSIYYDMAQVQGDIDAHLLVNGTASTYAIAGAEGDIRFPDGSAYASYDEGQRLAGIAAEWAARGLLPYENWLYGDPACSNNILFDRSVMNYYSPDEAANLDSQLGEASGDTYFMYTDDLHTIIRMVEDGMDLDRFFYGNILCGLTLQDLCDLADEGCTLAEVVDTIHSETSMSVYSTRAGNSMYVSGMSKYTAELGVVPALGPKRHGAMFKIITSQGQVARCLLYGGSLRTGDTFHEVDYSAIPDANGIPLSLSKYHALMAVAEQTDVVGGSDWDTQISQILTWYILANSVNPHLDGESVFQLVRTLYIKCFRVSDAIIAKDIADNGEFGMYGSNGILHAWVFGWLQRYRIYEGLSYDSSYVTAQRVVTMTFWASDAGGTKQPLMTWTSSGIVIDEKYGYLTVYKTDDKNATVPNCEFDIYNQTGGYVKSFITKQEPYLTKLKVGTYYIQEIKAADGYDLDKTLHKVIITENNTEYVPFSVTVVNHPSIPKVDIYKLESGQVGVFVKGNALLQILEKNTGNLVKEIYAGGSAVRVELEAGNYILREAKAPAGYVKAQDVEFTVPDNPKVLTDVKMYDDYISISIAKKDADDRDQYVKGALLALYPANANWEITSDAPYDQWITKETDHKIERIPAGNYILRELAAPDGYMRAAEMRITVTETKDTQYYVMYDNKRTLSILKVSYDEKTGQNEPLAGAGLQLWATDGNGNKTELIHEWVSTTEPHVINGVSINVVYILVETSVPAGYIGFGEKEIIFGHRHTAECYHKHGDGTCNSGSCSASITSISSFRGWWRHDGDETMGCEQCGTLKDSHGNTHCDRYCSAGHTTPGGPGSHPGETCGAGVSCTIDTTVPKCGLTEGDIDSQVIEVENISSDTTTKISVDKTGPSLVDATVTCELAGAKLELRNADNVAVYAWVTDGTPYIIEDIAPGWYTLVEVEAPDGYVTAAPIAIEVKDISTLQSFSMYDEDTELKVRKVDAQTKESVAGVTLQIYHANADGSRGAKYGGTIVTSLEDYVLRGIPVGNYLLVEEKASTGYAVADPVAFEVKNTASTQTVVMYDPGIRVEISKKDITTHEEIAGAQLKIWTTNAAGNKDKIYASWTTDGTPYMIEKMPAGKYILEESVAAAGFVRAADIPFTVTTTGDIQRVTMYDDYTRVEIDKLNNLGAEVPGAKMMLVAVGSNGAISGTYATWTTGETPHSLDHVPAGRYLLMEVEPPKGYLTAAPVTIEVRETTEIQKFMMKDEFYHIPLTLEKVHGMTGEQLKEDVEIDLYEWNAAVSNYELSRNFRFVRKADGTYSVTSSYAWAEEGNLYWTPANQGKFYFVETKTSEGYVIDPTPVYFNVLDDSILDENGVYRAHNTKPDGYFVNDSTRFANRPWQLKFNLKKVDAISGNVLTDEAAFALYEWSEAAGGYVVSPHYRIVRQENGDYTVENDYAWAQKEYLYYTEDNLGRFYYQEVTAPDGYELDAEKVYIDLAQLGFTDRPGDVSKEYKAHNADPASYYVNDSAVFANQPAHVRIRVPKVDRYTGSLIKNDAVFTVKAKDGSLSFPVTFEKQADGSYLSSEIYFEKTVENHNFGIFYVYEEKAPGNYYGDYADDDAPNTPDGEAGKNKYLFEVEMDLSNNGDTITITNDEAGEEFWNESQYGEVTIRKYDDEAEADRGDGNPITQGDIKSLDGAVYGLYAAEDIKAADGSGTIYRKGTLVRMATIGLSTTTDEQGYLLDAAGNRCIESGKEPALVKTPGSTNFQQVELGRYYVAEISPADGYLLDTTQHRGSEPQKYYVTFRYSDESEHVVLRGENASDADNNLTMDDASESKDIYSGDFVKKQAAQFIKLEDLSTETGKEPIEAGFSIYLLSDLSGVKDGTIAPAGEEWTKRDIATLKGYDFSSEQTAIVYKRPTEAWTDGDRAWLEATGTPSQYRVKEMWSDENGYFITPELPYGQYVLVETGTPEGKETADPMIVTIRKDSAAPQAIRYIGDETLECYIRLVKADGDGRTVLKEGAAYRIRLVSDRDSFDSTFWKIYDDGFLYYWNPLTAKEMGSSKNPFAVGNRVEDGKIVDCYIEMPYMLPFGDYELVEVAAPDGYVIAGSEQTLEDASSESGNDYKVVNASAKAVMFSVTNSVLSGENTAVDQYGRIIVTVRQKNHQQKGILRITKVGEQLYDAEISGTVSGGDSDVHTDFRYETAPVRGAEFEIYAAEDIYSQHIDSGSLGSYDADQYMVWEKGDIVGTITTDQMGYAFLADLYLGKYGIREVVAGDGFILNKFEDEFEITAAESTKNFIVYDSIYENQRQKVEINVVKKDADTDKPVAGATFALIAKENIVSSIAGNEGDIRNNGGYRFDYVPGEPRILIPAGTVIDCAVSDADGHAMFDTDLPLGQYIVKELAAPAGYYASDKECLMDASYQGQDTARFTLSCELLDKPVVVGFVKYDLVTKEELPGAYLEVVDEDGNVVDSWVSEREPHYIKYLEIGKTYIMRESKTVEGYVTAEEIEFTVLDMSRPREDEIPIQEIKMYDDVTKVQISKKDITNKEELPGAELELWTADAEGRKVECLEKWITGEEPHYIEMLPVGNYVLVEVGTPGGYVTAENVFFIVQDTGELQKVEMLDDVTKVQISKKDLTTKEELPGAKLQIWTVDGRGNKIDLIDEWISTEEPHYMEKLPVGIYALVEVSAPEDYLVAEEVTFTVKDTGEVQSIEMLDDYTKVKISKKDITTKEELPGANLEIWTVDENGNKSDLVDKWVSTEEPHYMEKLPVGKYVLVETSAPDGYLVAEEVAFVVKESGEIQQVEMLDDYTKIKISKKDITTKEELAGANLEIWTVDENGNKSDLVDKWVSTEEPHYMEKLPVGEYVLVETKAPAGYLVAEEVAFAVEESGEIQQVEMLDDYTKVEISKKDITTKEELPGAKLEVWTVDENGGKGELIEEWVSDREPHYIERMPAGDYILTELTAPDGYSVAEDVKFTVKESKEIQQVVIYDSRKPSPPTSTPTPDKPEADLDMSEFDMFQTGEGMGILGSLAIALVCLAVGAGTIVYVKKRKKK